LPPWPVSVGIRGGGPLVELLLEDSGGAAELAWLGGLQVAGVDPGGGPQHLNVGDQLGRHVSVRFGSPGRRFTFGVQADLVGELGDYV
jgi:hypothetical protein